MHACEDGVDAEVRDGNLELREVDPKGHAHVRPFPPFLFHVTVSGTGAKG